MYFLLKMGIFHWNHLKLRWLRVRVSSQVPGDGGTSSHVAGEAWSPLNGRASRGKRLKDKEVEN